MNEMNYKLFTPLNPSRKRWQATSFKKRRSKFNWGSWYNHPTPVKYSCYAAASAYGRISQGLRFANLRARNQI